MISDWIPVVLFYAFAGVLLASALAVITVRNSVYAALLLVLAFFSAAALWMLLEAEFLAITLVLVYVGAVMVLFLFVVMMLDVKSREKHALGGYGKVAIAVAVAMLLEMVMLFAGKLAAGLPETSLTRHAADYSNVRALAEELFTRYVFPFELAAVLLLVAIVAAILLTLRRRPDFKHLDPARQIAVKASDRMRVIKMPAEPQSSGDDK